MSRLSFTGDTGESLQLVDTSNVLWDRSTERLPCTVRSTKANTARRSTSWAYGIPPMPGSAEYN